MIMHRQFWLEKELHLGLDLILAYESFHPNQRPKTKNILMKKNS